MLTWCQIFSLFRLRLEYCLPVAVLTFQSHEETGVLLRDGQLVDCVWRRTSVQHDVRLDHPSLVYFNVFFRSGKRQLMLDRSEGKNDQLVLGIGRDSA